MVEEQIQKLKTLQESFDALSQGSASIEAKVDEVKEAVNNIDLTPIENKVDEGVSALSSKIDNIKLPEIDTTELAKQGENTEATNSAIYARLEDSLNLLDIQYANQINQLIGE